MEHVIFKKEKFEMIGKSIRVSMKKNEHSKAISQFWRECKETGDCEKLSRLAEGKGLIGACVEFDEEREEFTYIIAIEKPQNVEQGDFVVKEIPASTWASFKAVGPVPETIQKMWEEIFAKWFPTAGYEHAGTPALEIYLAGDSSAVDYHCEVWVPVISRSLQHE